MAMRRRVRLKPHSRPEAFEGAFSTDRTGGSFTGQTPGLPPTGGDELGEPSAPMIQVRNSSSLSPVYILVPAAGHCNL